MKSVSIRSAYQQGTAGSDADENNDSGETCPTCGAPKPISSDSVDAMIEHAKAMRPKPFKRQYPAPTPTPQPASPSKSNAGRRTAAQFDADRAEAAAHADSVLSGRRRY